MGKFFTKILLLALISLSSFLVIQLADANDLLFDLNQASNISVQAQHKQQDSILPVNLRNTTFNSNEKYIVTNSSAYAAAPSELSNIGLPNNFNTTGGPNNLIDKLIATDAGLYAVTYNYSFTASPPQPPVVPTKVISGAFVADLYFLPRQTDGSFHADSRWLLPGCNPLINIASYTTSKDATIIVSVNVLLAYAGKDGVDNDNLWYVSADKDSNFALFYSKKSSGLLTSINLGTNVAAQTKEFFSGPLVSSPDGQYAAIAVTQVDGVHIYSSAKDNKTTWVDKGVVPLTTTQMLTKLYITNSGKIYYVIYDSTSTSTSSGMTMCMINGTNVCATSFAVPRIYAVFVSKDEKFFTIATSAGLYSAYSATGLVAGLTFTLPAGMTSVYSNTAEINFDDGQNVLVLGGASNFLYRNITDKDSNPFAEWARIDNTNTNSVNAVVLDPKKQNIFSAYAYNSNSNNKLHVFYTPISEEPYLTIDSIAGGSAAAYNDLITAQLQKLSNIVTAYANGANQVDIKYSLTGIEGAETTPTLDKGSTTLEHLPYKTNLYLQDYLTGEYIPYTAAGNIKDIGRGHSFVDSTTYNDSDKHHDTLLTDQPFGFMQYILPDKILSNNAISRTDSWCYKEKISSTDATSIGTDLNKARVGVEAKNHLCLSSTELGDHAYRLVYKKDNNTYYSQYFSVVWAHPIMHSIKEDTATDIFNKFTPENKSGTVISGSGTPNTERTTSINTNFYRGMNDGTITSQENTINNTNFYLRTAEGYGVAETKRASGNFYFNNKWFENIFDRMCFLKAMATEVNENYLAKYPLSVSPNMTNTDMLDKFFLLIPSYLTEGATLHNNEDSAKDDVAAADNTAPIRDAFGNPIDMALPVFNVNNDK